MALNYGRCEKCGDYGFMPHGCMLFEVCREGEGEWSEQYGLDPEHALKRWAEDDDCYGDYTIVQAGERGELHMLIRQALHPDEVKRFHVFGEMVAKYHAHEAPK